jgi:hypothetical protein
MLYSLVCTANDTTTGFWAPTDMLKERTTLEDGWNVAAANEEELEPAGIQVHFTPTSGDEPFPRSAG